MTIEKELLRTLREETGAGIVDIQRALDAVGDDPKKAVELLRKQGKKIAEKKSERTAREGVIGAYVHTNGKVAAFVALACETDFVARNDGFRELAHDLALHVVAANPAYLSQADIPDEILNKEREIAHDQAQHEGKPEKIIEKIVAGKMEKYFAEHCLLLQPFVKDDTVTIQELLERATAKIGEKIELKRFVRMQL
ncbi:MAG: translation elongation factor Ts [bacterium]